MIPTEGCCRLCGRPVQSLNHEYVCDECGMARPAFDRVASCFRFENRARAMVLNYKFNRHLNLVDDFADMLEATVLARFRPEAVDLVLPFPVTGVRRFLRGYNQCEALAKALADRLDRRYLPRVIRRVNSPARQSSLNERERHENAADTIAVKRPALVRGRTVLVVDDILTTGSSLSECARALKEAGAWRVWAVTLARSNRD